MEKNDVIKQLFDRYIKGEIDDAELMDGVNYHPSLGQIIGKIKHALSITNDGGDKASIVVEFDFTTATDVDVKSWLCGSRAIAFQRPARALSVDEITALNNKIIIAQNAGQKVKSRAEQVSALIAIGLPKHIAEAAVDNPVILANIKLETPTQ